MSPRAAAKRTEGWEDGADKTVSRGGTAVIKSGIPFSCATAMDSAAIR